MEIYPDGSPVLRTSKTGNGTAFRQRLLAHARKGNLLLRGLRQSVVQFGCKIRFGNWMAEFLATDWRRCGHCSKPFKFRRRHRGYLRPVRLASWACVRGWPKADRSALLHEFGGA